ncbi:hypothetical protein H7097_04320 [Aeromicrobium sp.]|nr:hypothetical protein [Candidatus Saccharibacteria bacterium]
MSAAEKLPTGQSNFFSELVAKANAVPALHAGEGITIDDVQSGQTYYRKSDMQDPLSDLSYYIVKTDGGALGFSYYNGTPIQGKQILDVVNRSTLEILKYPSELHFPLAVSLLDATYGIYNRLHGRAPQHKFTHEGTYNEKADFRSKLVTEQVKSGNKVLLVGLVTQFVRDMIAKDIEVKVSDLSPELEGTEVYGVPITNKGNAWTLDALAECDDAIVTGACLATDTVDSIFETAEASSTKLHFYIETGNNFGPQLIDRGAASVVAEKYPFYDFPGPTRYEVFTK